MWGQGLVLIPLYWITGMDRLWYLYSTCDSRPSFFTTNKMGDAQGLFDDFIIRDTIPHLIFPLVGQSIMEQTNWYSFPCWSIMLCQGYFSRHIFQYLCICLSAFSGLVMRGWHAVCAFPSTTFWIWFGDTIPVKHFSRCCVFPGITLNPSLVMGAKISGVLGIEQVGNWVVWF